MQAYEEYPGRALSALRPVCIPFISSTCKGSLPGANPARGKLVRDAVQLQMCMLLRNDGHRSYTTGEHLLHRAALQAFQPAH